MLAWSSRHTVTSGVLFYKFSLLPSLSSLSLPLSLLSSLSLSQGAVGSSQRGSAGHSGASALQFRGTRHFGTKQAQGGCNKEEGKAAEQERDWCRFRCVSFQFHIPERDHASSVRFQHHRSSQQRAHISPQAPLGSRAASLAASLPAAGPCLCGASEETLVQPGLQGLRRHCV